MIPISFLFSGCKTGSKTTIKEIIKTQRAMLPADSIIQKQKKGIDIIASGNDPVAWSLEIDFDKIIDFTAADGNTLHILPAFSRKEIIAEYELYEAKTDLGPVIIKLFTINCSGTVANQSGRKLTVELQNKVYSGCGKYLYDHQLNDVWILETVNNVKQKANDFTKGIPYLEFNLQRNKMTGSDGCKNISSTIEVKGNRIKFSPFALSKTACNRNMVEKIFSEMLSDKLVDYYMENGKLFLYLLDDSKISFKRKDL